ncbi:hypothetical protein Agabi119p4_3236 [Agaricus bisporus var. burnettii]|uniref:UFSP1/2/DUB catalytic domain-containing protein n=1 Tax=Agaricus bisporus var. burnettii TaxID=192524 RepID=A0A8H7F6T3_AGABI|nr:hypothetical protein Agabi119p4_3236 [Agaricus bisporus var. burnettii]
MTDHFTCAFCPEDLQTLTISQRQDHYEAHLLAISQTNVPNVQASSSKRLQAKRQFYSGPTESWKAMKRKVENDVFWYPSLGVPPPRNFTPGLIPLLKSSLITLCTKGRILRSVLCDEKVVHISKELWDASWGCGYRNFLMLCTGLMEQQTQPLYLSLLDTQPSPSVRSLQSWVHSAWDNGYDQVGRNELRNRLMETNKWIGTAEIYVALSFRGIPAELLDFDGFRDKEDCAAAVIRWMVKYFDSEYSDAQDTPSTSINDTLGKTTPVIASQLMPVILQHRGHSRLIVGYQQETDGSISLLTFDTGRLLPLALRNLARSNCGLSESISPECPQVETPVHEQSNGERLDNVKPITLRDLLTPSELELGMENPAETPSKNLKHASTKPTILSYLKLTHRRKKDKVVRDSKLVNEKRKAEPDAPDPNQLQRVFKLTFQQLLSNKEYQVLYVPLRTPLTKEERLSRRVIRCRRISCESMI